LSAGLGSNSKYSTLGSIRCIAQSISYEVSLSVLFLSLALLFGFRVFCSHAPFLFFCYIHLAFLAVVIFLAESNRSPFDFAEGESELVSGYNVDFRGSGFVLLFLSEYLSILFMSTLLGYISFFGSSPLAALGAIIFAFIYL